MNEAKFDRLQLQTTCKMKSNVGILCDDIDSEDSLNLSDISGAESADDSCSDDSYFYPYRDCNPKKSSCTSTATLVANHDNNPLFYANKTNSSDFVKIPQKYCQLKNMQINRCRPKAKRVPGPRSSSISSNSSSEGSFILSQLSPDFEILRASKTFKSEENGKNCRIKSLNDQKCRSKSLGSIFASVPSMTTVESCFVCETQEGEVSKYVKRNFAVSLPMLIPLCGNNLTL